MVVASGQWTLVLRVTDFTAVMTRTDVAAADPLQTMVHPDDKRLRKGHT